MSCCRFLSPWSRRCRRALIRVQKKSKGQRPVATVQYHTSTTVLYCCRVSRKEESVRILFCHPEAIFFGYSLLDNGPVKDYEAWQWEACQSRRLEYCVYARGHVPVGQVFSLSCVDVVVFLVPCKIWLQPFVFESINHCHCHSHTQESLAFCFLLLFVSLCVCLFVCLISICVKHNNPTRHNSTRQNFCILELSWQRVSVETIRFPFLSLILYSQLRMPLD